MIRTMRGVALVLALAALAGAGASPVHAQGFPDLSVWAYPGVFRAGPDSIEARARAVTVRWLRDPAAEARQDFGGYRIYRVTTSPDTARLVLLRRFSVNQPDSAIMWHFPRIDGSSTDQERVATFVDPDS